MNTVTGTPRADRDRESMSPSPTSTGLPYGARRPRRFALGLSGLLVLAGLACSWIAGRNPRRPFPPRHRRFPLPVTGLPVVARLPATQPAVGLPRTRISTPRRRGGRMTRPRRMGGRNNRTVECHRLLTARWHHDRPMAEHRDLVLEHGKQPVLPELPSPTNRKRVRRLRRRGSPKPTWSTLCAKCHGPIYRDWEAGVRLSNGFLEPPDGRSDIRCSCIQCMTRTARNSSRCPRCRRCPSPRRPPHAAGWNPPPLTDLDHDSPHEPRPHNEVRSADARAGFALQNRRTFLGAPPRWSAGGLVAALKPLLASAGEITLTPCCKATTGSSHPPTWSASCVTSRTSADATAACGRPSAIPKPLDGVRFAYALNLTRCIGCRKCAMPMPPRRTTSPAPTRRRRKDVLHPRARS